MAGRRPSREAGGGSNGGADSDGAYIGAMLLIASMKTRCCGFEKLTARTTERCRPIGRSIREDAVAGLPRTRSERRRKPSE